VNAFKESLQQAVSCVTGTVITLSPDGYRPSTVPHRLVLGNGTPVTVTARLPTSEVRFGLSVLHAYRIIRAAERGPWKVQTAAYQYALDDDDGREIFAYHWHPHVERVPYPHLHIGRGAVRREITPDVLLPIGHNALQPFLPGAHLPTRRIALEDFLRLLIEQFHVVPARADWDRTLREARASFQAHRTWV
jgi:hypothetical protein